MSGSSAVARLLAALMVASSLLTAAPATASAAPAAASAAPAIAKAAPAGVPSVEEDAGPGRQVRIDDIGHDGHARARIRKWRGDTIRYWADLPRSYSWSLKTAVKAWNDTGLDMRFVPASRRKAQLKITVGPTGGGLGLASVGYQARNYVYLAPRLATPSFGESAAYARVLAARIIAHELGHNLGLQHSRGCQLMTAVVSLPDCRLMDADQPGYYACRIVDTNALGKAVSVYGGNRTQPPAACPVEKVPPALTGVRFEGGFSAEEPVSLGWDPPPRVPRGSEVLGFVAAGEACVFPVVQDYYKEAKYDDSAMRVKHLDPTAGTWQPPAEGVERRCYGLTFVNRHGAGRAVQSQVVQSWIPRSSSPEVLAVRRYADSWYAGLYKTTVTWSPADAGLLVLVRPKGECVSEWPAGVPAAEHRTYAEPAEPFDVDASDNTGEPIPEPCLSFFVEGDHRSRTSLADTWQVGVEPLPEPPTITTVQRTGRYEHVPDVVWDVDVAFLAVVVRPEGQCVSSWPGGDPEEMLVDYAVETPGVLRPCLSFFTVNTAGAVSTASATWQVPPAPVPPTPALTHVSYDEGYVEGRTDLDPDVFGLAAVVGPTGQCPSTIPAGTEPADHAVGLWYDGEAGGTAFYHWTSGAAPCVTYFAYNVEGAVGPGVEKQF